MSSSFAWLDYSEQERRRALDVISLFKQAETRDELGLGSIRDALADRFSPGTMTLQTRAKYFLLIPWMYQYFEQRQVESRKLDLLSRQFEIRLIDILADSADSGGTIGIESRKVLQRMPSSIYWAGLGRLGIRIFPGFQSQYYRSLDDFHRRVRQLRELPSDPGNRIEEPVNWHPHIPDAPDGFPDGVSLALTTDEAEYLRDRIRATDPGSLLAHLVELKRRWKSVTFSWEHPRLAEFPELLSIEVNHARMFSEVLHGAALLYNLMLAEKRKHDPWIANFDERFEEWAMRIDSMADEVKKWDRGGFWHLVDSQQAKIPLPTRRFINTWLDLATTSSKTRGIKSDPKARSLIIQRETRLKMGRARLQSKRHLELWQGSSGTAQLDFRWKITEDIALDILRALA